MVEIYIFDQPTRFSQYVETNLIFTQLKSAQVSKIF